jgi:hypothetical protein
VAPLKTNGVDAALKIKKEIPFMRVTKNYWLAACGTLAVGSAVMLFSAHRIEAQYSTPVKVLNTSAGPVLNSRIDDPGRIPFVSAFSNVCSGNVCTSTFAAVPAGHRVVIQNVSALLDFNSAPAVLTVYVGSTGSTQSQFNVQAIPSAGNSTAFDLPAQSYVDAGQSPVVIVNCSGGVTFNPVAGQSLNLIGYELDCNAAPCAAIANH